MFQWKKELATKTCNMSFIPWTQFSFDLYMHLVPHVPFYTHNIMNTK